MGRPTAERQLSVNQRREAAGGLQVKWTNTRGGSRWLCLWPRWLDARSPLPASPPVCVCVCVEGKCQDGYTHGARTHVGLCPHGCTLCRVLQA